MECPHCEKELPSPPESFTSHFDKNKRWTHDSMICPYCKKEISGSYEGLSTVPDEEKPKLVKAKKWDEWK